MGRIIYSDGRTALTTTAFRYKLTDSAGTLVKDWTTGATWTEEPAGTYYLDDAAAVPGTRYAVEPATGEVGGAGMVPWGKPAATGDAMTLTAAYDAAKAAASQASVNAIPTTPLLAEDYTAPDNATIAAAAASAASADGKATTLLARNNPLSAAATQAATQAAIVAEGVSTFNATSDPVEVGGLSLDGAADVRDAMGLTAADLDEKLDQIAGALKPTEGVLITPTTVGDDGLPLGRIMPYGTIRVYLGETLQYAFDEIGDADGDFVLTLPYGSTWTLVAENPPKYRATRATITTPDAPV